MIRIERNPAPSAATLALSYVGACVMGFAISALLIAATGYDPAEAFGAIWQGAVGSQTAMIGSLVKATPLILTGLAAAIAFRARLWSIGQEGQVYAGAMAGWCAVLLVPDAPALLLIPLALILGAAGGAGLGAVAAGLRTRYGVNEIISTVMLNYIIVYLLSWLLSGGAWGEVGATVSYQQSPPAPEAAQLPNFDDRGRLHLGFAIALAASLACAVLIARTPLGFEIRALGGNGEALRRRGVDVGRLTFVVMALSGALAGLAGIGEVLGVTDRLRGDELYGLGYAGVVIGLIAGLRPIGVLVAGLFFGGLANGAVFMSVLSDAPAALAQAIQGVLLISILCGGVAARTRLRRTVAHVG